MPRVGALLRLCLGFPAEWDSLYDSSISVQAYESRHIVDWGANKYEGSKWAPVVCRRLREGGSHNF